MKKKIEKIVVVGAGAWGTAVANYLASIGLNINIWAREQEVISDINNQNKNNTYLKNILLSHNLKACGDLDYLIKTSNIIVFAVPSNYIGDFFRKYKNDLKDKIIVNLSKGFEAESMKTISDLAQTILGKEILNNWVGISGPSFAMELAQNHPTAIVAVSHREELAAYIQENFSSKVLRVYRSTDLIGVEVAAAMKNVMAIASGVVSGCGYKYNTTASLVTRATVEIARLGTFLGGKKETFSGLAGIGDLMLTCFGTLSRNFQLGERIAKGESLNHILDTTLTVAEGVETAKAISKLSKKLDVEMPISNEVYKVLFENKSPLEALKDLMNRTLKKE